MRYFRRYTSAMHHLFSTAYHPERHYMRGPGPACAKRGNGNSAHA